MYRCVVVVKRQALDALDEITNSCVVEREWRIRIDREIEIVVKVSDGQRTRDQRLHVRKRSLGVRP